MIATIAPVLNPEEPPPPGNASSVGLPGGVTFAAFIATKKGSEGLLMTSYAAIATIGAL